MVYLGLEPGVAQTNPLSFGGTTLLSSLTKEDKGWYWPNYQPDFFK